MEQASLSSSLQRLVKHLASIPGVVAVSLGGSRARGEARPDSDWDFSLYYRGHIDANDLRSLGYPGHVVEPGAWGRLVNGGGWLMIEGQHVDVLYRDLDVVEHWYEEAQQGRFEVDNVAGLTGAEEILASIGREPEELTKAVGRMRQSLDLAQPLGMQADAVVKTAR